VRYRFGDCMLDGARRELSRGGALIPVEPQVFDLIELLIRNCDRVVTRDDLIAHVWHGRIVSESTLATRINAARKAIGDDGTAQRLIKTVARKGVRFVGTVQTDAGDDPWTLDRAADLDQQISFCRTSDGVSLAVSAVGNGPPLVKAANWLNHLEYDWQSPIWSPMLRRLAARFRLIRYDGRGNGLADWEAADVSFAAFCRDLETVVATLDLPRFVLLGLSQGAATAVAFAVAHPDRVSRLILYGGYPQGRNRRGSADDAATAQTVLGMMRQGWGRADSAFMRAFASLYLPNGSPEQIRWFAEMQKLTTSGDMAARLRVACDDIDIVELLPRLRVPTLVLHARDDHVVPVAQSRMMAAMIPGARFATLPSENHVPLPDEPAWELLLKEIECFVAAPS